MTISSCLCVRRDAHNTQPKEHKGANMRTVLALSSLSATTRCDIQQPPGADAVEGTRPCLQTLSSPWHCREPYVQGTCGSAVVGEQYPDVHTHSDASEASTASGYTCHPPWHPGETWVSGNIDKHASPVHMLKTECTKTCSRDDQPTSDSQVEPKTIDTPAPAMFSEGGFTDKIAAGPTQQAIGHPNGDSVRSPRML